METFLWMALGAGLFCLLDMAYRAWDNHRAWKAGDLLTWKNGRMVKCGPGDKPVGVALDGELIERGIATMKINPEDWKHWTASSQE